MDLAMDREAHLRAAGEVEMRDSGFSKRGRARPCDTAARNRVGA
jgi:hypothetical protein